MADTAFSYLSRRFFARIYEFLRHWYVDSSKIYVNGALSFLEKADKLFAWKITLLHIFQPLYKDYSIPGYLLGFLFRVSRVVLASVFYLVVFAVVLFLYAVWLAAPIFIVYKIFV